MRATRAFCRWERNSFSRFFYEVLVVYFEKREPSHSRSTSSASFRHGWCLCCCCAAIRGEAIHARETAIQITQHRSAENICFHLRRLSWIGWAGRRTRSGHRTEARSTAALGYRPHAHRARGCLGNRNAGLPFTCKFGGEGSRLLSPKSPGDKPNGRTARQSGSRKGSF